MHREPQQRLYLSKETHQSQNPGTLGTVRKVGPSPCSFLRIRYSVLRSALHYSVVLRSALQYSSTLRSSLALIGCCVVLYSTALQYSSTLQSSLALDYSWLTLHYWPQRRASVLESLGNIAFLQTNYSRALTLHQEALGQTLASATLGVHTQFGVDTVAGHWRSIASCHIRYVKTLTSHQKPHISLKASQLDQKPHISLKALQLR